MADLRSERFRNQNTRLNVVQVKDLIPVVDDMQDIIDGDFAFEDPIEYSNATGITAGTTQTQAGATALTEEQNNVTTVATAGDGVALPAAIAGGAIKVKNSGAGTLAVYPATADSINALPVNLSVDIAPNSEMTFRAISATVWETNEVLTLPAASTQTGSLVIQASDSAGNTNTTITNASQAGARTYTIPDGGTDASFLLTEGTTQTIATGDVALSDGSLSIVDASLTSGTALSITTGLLSTGKGLEINAGIAMAATGSLARLNMGAGTAGSALEIDCTGTYVGTDSIINVTAINATTGNISSIIATGLTSGNAIDITGGGLNTLAASSLIRLDMGAATHGAAIEIINTGVYTDVGIVSIEADSAITGDVISVTADALTTGRGMFLDSSSTMTGVGKLMALQSSGITTGTILHVNHTGSIIANGGSLCTLISDQVNTADGTPGSSAANFNSVSTAQTAGVVNAFVSSAVLTGTLVAMNCTTATTGTILSITGAAGATALNLASGLLITAGTASLSGAGAIPITQPIAEWTTTGAQAGTLADGTEGQVLNVVMIADGGAGTLTPTNFASGATMTFDDVGDTANLLFTNGTWFFMGGTSTVA